jgi:coenzyme F420 hydrogenase subunit beta
MTKSSACQEIDRNVIKKGLCTLCGACAGTCPYFACHEGRVLLRDVCDLSQGHCLVSCPRMSFDLDRASEIVFGVAYSGTGFGAAHRVVMARATDAAVKVRAQDAGTVTVLTRFAIEEGFIDSAVLTRFEGTLWPTGKVASTSEQVVECSRSSYLAAPTVEAFNRVLQDVHHQSMGFIGTPCQVMALANMRTAPPDISKGMEKLKLTIGLFCTWALSYPDLSHFIGRSITDPIVKYEIPPHPANVFIVYTEKDRISFPIDVILPFVRPACRSCLDLTAEFADISVGSGRGEVLNWNTVVIRTQKGAELIDSAAKKGVIETTPIPEENLNRLKKAASNKRKKAIGKIIQMSGSEKDLLYLKARPEVIKRLVTEYKEGSS